MEVFFEQHPDLVPLPKKHPYEERDGWGNPPRTESDDKYGHYYMKSNAFVDWRLPIPATVYRVWDALQRHANKQPGRLVRRVSIELLSAECYQQSRTITKAVNYLDAIRGIKILVKGGSRHQGGRLTSVYLVPSLAALCMPVLLKAIKATPYRGFRMKD
jgi:hypothetical protein